LNLSGQGGWLLRRENAHDFMKSQPWACLQRLLTREPCSALGLAAYTVNAP